MKTAEFAVVLTTLPVNADAGVLAQQLVEESLAACVNVLPPMVSVYRWKGAIETARERQLLIKTRVANVATLQQRLKELHPYEVPEVLVLPIAGGSNAYLNWLREISERPT
jgi:periplasmic divalent cation tolerance protein